MENLNNLIWTDEDGNNGDDIQFEHRPMRERCMVAFCTITAGTSFVCRGDASLSSAAALCAPG